MMATVSSHVLNAVDGTHAGGVRATLARITGARCEVLFSAETDAGGRLVQELDLSNAAPDDRYELVLATGPYWATHQSSRDAPQIMSEIVIRFSMPDPTGRYHIPVISSPNSYSVWWSS